jgi:hypothetical protein
MHRLQPAQRTEQDRAGEQAARGGTRPIAHHQPCQGGQQRHGRQFGLHPAGQAHGQRQAAQQCHRPPAAEGIAAEQPG